MRLQHNSRPTRGTWLIGLASMILLSSGVGCKNGFLDPSEMGRFERKTLVRPILRHLDTEIEEVDPKFRSAVAPTAEDLVPMSGDYVLGPNDFIMISIGDLAGPNIESMYQKRISDSGKISLPLIGQIQAAGLAEAQLETAIHDTYRDRGYIQDANVAVTVYEARNRTFSVSGAVARPGQYQILQSDFRLLDAINIAGGGNFIGIDHAYVIRKIDANGGAGTTDPATRPSTDVLTPRAQRNVNGGDGFAFGDARRVSMKTEGAQPDDPMAPSDPTTQPGDQEGRRVIIEGQPVVPGEPVTPPDDTMTPPPDTTTQRTNGRPPQDTLEQFDGFNALPEPTNVKVIRVPLDALVNRVDLRANIVIRPGDHIMVPNPMIGEYYMGGHVARVGVYSLTARNITLKQAVVGAGMLDQLAIPSRCQIVRRLEGQDYEIYTMVDLAKIHAGEAPDLYLKPDDVVTVGTTFYAPFLAAVRNGFRVTYGFGFLYDRNYYDDDDNDF